MTQHDEARVPKDVIGDDEDVRTKARKVLFSDNNEITVIDKEGIEKRSRFDLETGTWEDEACHVIPFFETGSGHCLVDPEVPAIDATL